MIRISRARRALAALATTTFLLAAAAPARAGVDLADSPLFSSVSVPGNLLLALSVEFPTASTAAYASTTAYTPATEFVGYFDPNKCYTYSYNSASPSQSYFVPNSWANQHACSNMWSGNWLNWASMQSLDEFRWVLTGGNRTQDSPSSNPNLTVLTKTYHSGQSSSTNTAQNKSITTASLINGATPLPTSGTGTTWGTVYSRTAGTGIMMLISASSSAAAMNIATATSPPTSPATYTPAASSYTVYTGSGTFSSSTVYALYMNVQVCASAALKESNCVLYGSTYKPEGLMQSYSGQLRYAAMGYLSDPSYPDTPNIKRDGGVLRARMNYVGPTKPVPGSTAIANPVAEWSSVNGVMLTNPAPTDASNTATAGASAIQQSGVMNYLNKFGYTSQLYKTYDPVGELYYAALRYLKNQAPVTTYSSLASDSTPTTLLDGFPVIITSPSTPSDDPILYSCQKNFILGIGDTNTNYDADLPGSTLWNSSTEPSIPPEVTADASAGVNVATSTNMINFLETGSTGLASTRITNGTYYIGGLAYDAHTKGVRTYTDSNGNVTVSTVNTYWLDVLEGQTYAASNQYYYAAKYGGFSFPPKVYPFGTVNVMSPVTTIQPYSSSNAQNTIATSVAGNTVSLALSTTSPLTNTLWHTNTDRCFSTSLCSSSNTSGNYRPDNYFTANNAAAMRTGLTTAFAKIASEANAANTTVLATSTPNTTTVSAGSTSVSYGANYDPSTWTGQVTASTITFNPDGTVASTAQNWDARALLTSRLVQSTPALSSAAAAARYVVTCCTTGSPPQGLQFNASALSGSVNPRTNYASFGAVPGVASQSPANFLAYLRGDSTQELAPNGTGVYRARSFKLGDIVNAKPVAVSVPSATYSDARNPGYSTFKATYASRAPVVYVGANDGMLHAFDGSTPPSTTGGKELFAYVPSFVYGNGTSTTLATTGLALLGNPTFSHRFLVDATPGQFDLDLNNTISSSARLSSTYQPASATPAWSTLLIGGLGKGGTGYYAIDVTNPTTWTSEAMVASKVLWEFTDSTMGYTYGTPSVVKTAKYGWVVVMTSGYSNTDGKGYFYFVNPLTGALLEKVATSSGSPTSPINMGQHTAYVVDYTDGTADAIYGVDLQGDVWRVDVTGTNPSVAYSAPTLIATLTDANGNAQPITTRPLIQPDTTSSARYVLVGTGRLLGNSDISSTISNVQSFYAIVDGTANSGGFYTASTLPTGLSFPVMRTQLNSVTDLTVGISGSTTGKIGWYYDMPVTTTTDSSGVTTYIAQRVSTDPIATQGVIAWAGNLPNGSACSPSGTGTTYATAFSTGRTVLVDSMGNPLASVTDSAGIITELSLLNENGTIRLNSGDSAGNITPNQTRVPTTSGPKQLNWRDVPLAN